MLAEIAAGIEGVEVKTHAATGNPAAAIVRVAEEVGADLIVVGSKGMTAPGAGLGAQQRRPQRRLRRPHRQDRLTVPRRTGPVRPSATVRR